MEFPGIDVFQLDAEQLIGLEANVPMVRARRLIAGGVGHLDWDTVYQVYLDAYGDEQLASRAAADVEAERQRQEATSDAG